MHGICNASNENINMFHTKKIPNIYFLINMKASKYIKQITYLKTIKIMRNIDVVFVENMTSVGNDLEMHPSGRNEAPMVVGMDESSISSLFDLGEDIEDCEESRVDHSKAFLCTTCGWVFFCFGAIYLQVLN